MGGVEWEYGKEEGAVSGVGRLHGAGLTFRSLSAQFVRVHGSSSLSSLFLDFDC